MNREMDSKRKRTSKPRYSMWQNTAFMVRQAWRTCPSVIGLCIVLAAATAGQTVAELLITPAILRKVETAAPLPELLWTIAVFGGVLFLVTGLQAYLNQNAIFGRILVRLKITRMIGDKMAGTSYPNLLDTDFLIMEDKAHRACRNNEDATEHIWTTWTDILTNLMGFVVYLALLSGLDLRLMGVVIAATAAGYLINVHTSRWEYQHREEEASYVEGMDYLRRVATDRSYAKDIRIFGLKNWLDDVWDRIMRLYQGYLSRRERVYLWIHVADLLLTFLRNGIAYAYLLRLVLTEGMGAAQFLLYFGAVSGFAQWVTGILERFSDLHRESLSLSALREFLEWPEPFLLEGGKAIQPEPGKGYEICLEDVSFRYPGTEWDTIRHMNLTVHAGEKLAVVGQNGAGKTTLVKLICGFLDPTEGRVLLNGQDIRGYNRQDYYELFSSVFQDFSVLEASVSVNVAQRMTEIDEGRVWQCLEQAGLAETIRSLPQGLETSIGRQVYEDGVELSGGQTQRMMLARALYKDGPILILDEPTAALDPIAEHDIYRKYDEMTSGKTAVFISHRLASTRFCHRILLIADGAIAEEGTHDSLIAAGGSYAELFEVQSQYYREGGENHER